MTQEPAVENWIAQDSGILVRDLLLHILILLVQRQYKSDPISQDQVYFKKNSSMNTPLSCLIMFSDLEMLCQALCQQMLQFLTVSYASKQ